MKEKKINIFSEPEVIDSLIKNRLSTFSRKGGTFNNKANNWTEDELEIRNAVILDYIGKQGCSREETARQISIRWDITMSCARSYVAKAIKDFAANWSEEDKDEIRKTYINRVEGILQEALENHQLDSAMKAQEMLNKINGLYSEKQQIELSGNIPIVFDFS